MKSRLLITALAFCMFFSVVNHTQAYTITSTTAGGLWNSSSTWIGGIIPGVTDTAIVQGPVIIGHVVVYQIYHSYGGWVVIESGGSLSPHIYGAGLGTFNFYVTGDITNNGSIYNDGEYLDLLVNGNITNNGIWQPHQTILTGLENQNLLLGEGALFGGNWTVNNTTSVTALSNLRYNGAYSFESNNYTGDFNLNGNSLNMGVYSINTTGSIIYNGTIQVDFSIAGLFNVNKDLTDTLVFQGNINITDTLQNSTYGAGSGIMALKLLGNMVNNGVIRDNPDGDELHLMISGNIVNNGEWSCNFVSFTGNNDQYLEGEAFESHLTDLDSASKIMLNSDVHCTQNINLNQSTLDGMGHHLYLDGWLYDGFIYNLTLHNGVLQDIESMGSLCIKNKVTVDNNNTFHNDVTIADTLQSNNYIAGSIFFDLHVEGNLVNNGVIQNINNDDYLRLLISGNVENNGEWNHSETVLNGSANQLLVGGQDIPFGGNFINSNLSGSILAGSDLYFTGNVNLNGGILSMQGQNLLMQNWLSNASLDQAIVQGGTLHSVHATGSLAITGTVKMDEFNIFDCDVTVYDTLQSNTFSGGSKNYDVIVNGNLTNQGVIQSWGSGNLRLYLAGNIHNYATWNSYLTCLNGTDDQYIYLYNNQPLNGMAQFDAVLNTAPFQWYYEGEMLNSPDFGGQATQVLNWNIPVQANWYGTFYCQTGAGNSRNIIVHQGMFPPQNLFTTLNCTSAELVWEMPGGNPDSWNVYRNNEFLVNVDQMQYADNDLWPDADYEYYTTAVYAGDESDPTNVSVISVPMPDNLTPVSFEAAFNEPIVALSWGQPTGCAVPLGYNVYMDDELLTNEPVPDTYFEHDPEPGTHVYTVTAVYYFIESEPAQPQTVVVVSMAENTDPRFEVFPNPAKNLIHVRLESKAELIELYSVEGTCTGTWSPLQTSAAINLEGYKPGMYILIVKTRQGYYRQKISIE